MPILQACGGKRLSVQKDCPILDFEFYTVIGEGWLAANQLEQFFADGGIAGFAAFRACDDGQKRRQVRHEFGRQGKTPAFQLNGVAAQVDLCHDEQPASDEVLFDGIECDFVLLGKRAVIMFTRLRSASIQPLEEGNIHFARLVEQAQCDDFLGAESLHGLSHANGGDKKTGK